ncbi:MAG: hypothetical protein ABI281_14315 [Caldimonas sp.]
MNEIEFVEPSPTGKTRLIAVYLAVMAACAVPFLIWPRVASSIGHLPACEQIPWLRSYLVGALAVLLLFAAAVGLHGYKILRFRSFLFPERSSFVEQVSSVVLG